MSNFKCHICQIANPEPSHFWKMHKIKESLYYLTYFPKFDKLTGDVLSFKDRDSYILVDFLNKNNKNKWIKQQNLETRQDYLRQLLINRFNLKSWKYIPTQVEMRSCPELFGINYYNQNFKEGYYELCKNIGYLSREFININEKTILKNTRTLRGNPILVDSREQKMINWGNKEIKISTLPYADYCLEKDNYGIYFERKQLDDFINSMSQGFDRICREIERAKNNNDYIIMMVEDTLSNAMSFEYLSHISKKIQATSSFIMHRTRELIQTFSNFQILFNKGRTELVQNMRFIMEYGENARNIDWMLASDLKLLNSGI